MLDDKTLDELDAEFGEPENTPTQPEQAAITICLADVKAEPIKWLWSARIPLGKVTILTGDPGLGKSLVTLALAAAVSRGTDWPIRGEGAAPLGDVILISAEDDAADTIKPRLEAAGADLCRVHMLVGVPDVNADCIGETRGWTLADTEALGARLIALPECRLVVVDPISAYLAGTDSHKNSDVRELLAPLAALAVKHGVAVVGVSHLNKSAGPAMYRTTGSLAFVAAARAVYAVARDKENAARRLIALVKANLAPDASGLAYTIQTVDTPIGSQPVVAWETEPATITADDVLQVEPEQERSATDEATDWLRDLLSNDPMKAADVQREARQAGIGEKALRRARERLRIHPKKGGFSGGWIWELPTEDAQGAQDAPSGSGGNFGGEGHVGGSDGCTAEQYRKKKNGD